MNSKNNDKIILTLDAGGTNFVFSALKGGETITEPIHLKSNADNLKNCINTIYSGFKQTTQKCPVAPDAISFAFPGPADYKNGVIGDLNNLPAFRGGVPLGPMLEKVFGIPVFINNDGNLFAYGEATAGFLPYVNKKLKEAGNKKQYKTLIGITLGTGLGAGIVLNNNLVQGDNFAAGEVWASSNKLYPETIAEESVSIRGIQRVYCQHAQIDLADSPTPEDIFHIAEDRQKGNKTAAIKAFNEFSETLGETLLNTISLLDGIVVLGGGLAGASSLFLQKTVNAINKKVVAFGGNEVKRLASHIYNLESLNEYQSFLKPSFEEVEVPGSDKKVDYIIHKKSGIGLSKLGTNKAVMLGAYYYAVNNLEKS